MTTDLEAIENPATSSEPCPLQQYITRRWNDLLQQQRLEIDLQPAAHAPCVRCEIFIGDEFIHADKLHLDVVVRLQPNNLLRQDLPTVLVFEKHSLRLVQQELNGLRLETPVLAGLASSAQPH